jgi:SpoVK/Ycf46/Vps4 family AAA+-type ATPase
VLASLLTEMDGIDGAASEVFVIAATNRLESIDAALLRKVISLLSTIYRLFDCVPCI